MCNTTVESMFGILAQLRLVTLGIFGTSGKGHPISRGQRCRNMELISLDLNHEDLEQVPIASYKSRKPRGNFNAWELSKITTQQCE